MTAWSVLLGVTLAAPCFAAFACASVCREVAVDLEADMQTVWDIYQQGDFS